MYHTAEPVMRWWKQHQEYLIDRTPVASIGVVWSQRNTDFFGRDAAADRVDAPYTGFMHALVRARIPYLGIHADDIDAQGAGLDLLVLPNVGALSDAQGAAIRRFVQRGGSLVATGLTGLYDEWGDPRADFLLADLFACHRIGETPKLPSGGQASGSVHTYLRLSPELRARVDGPEIGDEPPVTGKRHAVLRGFGETDILPYGGVLEPLKVHPAATVPLTFVPAFPTYPPETSWMRVPKTDVAGLVLSQHGKSRVAFMPADIDRRYAREHLPDHAALLANVVRWAAEDRIPLSVQGPGLIDCHLYEQPNRRILHLVNLTSEATWRAPLDELIPVGPFTVRIERRGGARPSQARLLVAGVERPVQIDGSTLVVRVDSILDHEVIVI